METVSHRPVAVCIRGAAGLLGSRLNELISRTPHILVAAGVYKNDATLERLLERAQFAAVNAHPFWRQRCFLDESLDVVTQVNQAQAGRITFEPISALHLNQVCDVVIDAGVGRDHALQKQYATFSGPIILQDGEYPRGRLIAPPLIAPAQGGNRYRQGGCLLSGIVPVLAPWQQQLCRVRLHIVMQHDGRDADFLITERLNSFRMAEQYRPRLEDELTQLFPGAAILVDSIIQIPGLLHYAVTIEAELQGSWSKAEISETLSHCPRIRILPDGVLGTYEVNLARAVSDSIPPILVFGGSIEANSSAPNTTTVRLCLGLYYRTLAVLPNVDAIHMLAHGLTPLEAMRQTDRAMGF